MTEVAQGIHRLTQGVVNFYLVEDGGKLVLVDAGAPGDWTVLVAAVAAMGRSLDDVDAVLVTHAHADHTGFAEKARTEAHARVWIHEADVAQAQGERPPKNDGSMHPYLTRAQMYRTAFSLLRRGARGIVPIRELSSFADGEVLDVPGRPRVVHAPGHTAGTCALLVESPRVLFTGDALVTRNPLTGREGPQIMPSGFNRDTPQALESLSALAGIDADVLLPGHGEPWRDGMSAALDAARAAGPS